MNNTVILLGMRNDGHCCFQSITVHRIIGKGSFTEGARVSVNIIECGDHETRGRS